MFSVHIIITCRYVFRKYYTDFHDVDEDTRTMPRHGGAWASESYAGTAYRTMNPSSYYSDIVASKK